MMATHREIRERLKSGIHGLFVIGQKMGFDILPRHFYSNIPNIPDLLRHDSWKHPSAMPGVAGLNPDLQLEFLRECCSSPMQERMRQSSILAHASRENGEPGYGPVEADFLFAFIALKQPKRIVQIGAGVSTAVVLLAAKEAGYSPAITCVDPFPSKYLRRIAQGNLIKLVTEPAQEVDIDLLFDLSRGDLLFVDSSHAVRPGSEVNRIILEVLPRLGAGCFVHFHDIYFPYDYQSSVLTTLFFGGESTLLHAFLIHNSRYSIAVSMSMLHHARPLEMQSVLPNYRPEAMEDGLHTGSPGHFPSATYLRVL